MVKFLVIGKDGQLGKELVKTLINKGKNFTALGHKDCDISNLNRVLEVFEEFKPDVVINCVAYNQVDKAEEDDSTAIKVNSLGVKNLAEDKTNPVNEYGKSKLLGELFLKEETKNYLIFRTSWVYGEGKQNFIYKLMQWAENNSYLKIAYDEISVPTSTKTIVNITLKALENGLTGLYHLTNSGYASRYEWAKKVFEIKGINKFIKPVSSDIFNLPAKRPKFSAISNKKLQKILNIEIPRWDRELEEVLI